MSKIWFRYGAMNCGKTTSLLQAAHNYEEQGLNIILIKPKIDKKGEDKVVSRLGIERKVDILLDSTAKLKDVIKLKSVNCIIVDEAQFLKAQQVKDLWIISKLNNIPVLCYGLKTNFKGELFEGSKALLEVADEIEELITICKCGKRAKFNARVKNNKYVKTGEEIQIDGISATYEPLCGKCYIENVLGFKNTEL